MPTKDRHIHTPLAIFDVYWTVHRCENQGYEPPRCYLLFYYTYDKLNMFRALLCPLSGSHDYSADYHMGRPVLGLLLVGS